MNSYNERIAAKRARAQAEIAELEREAELAELLPDGMREPYMIHRAASDDPLVSYKVETLADALAIVRAFPEPLDVAGIEAGCFSIEPFGFHVAPYAGKEPRWEVYQAIEVRQHGGRGFYTATVEFWCAVANRPRVKVSVEVARFPWKLRASVNATYDQQGNVSNATFREGDLPHFSPAARVKFGDAGRDSFDIRHYFSGADHFSEIADSEKVPA